MMKIGCYGFCLVAGALLARFELRSDDTGVEVFFILLATFLLGAAHPRNAWQWALLVGPWIPAAELVEKLSGGQGNASLNGGLWMLAAFVVLIGLVGTYLGVLLRKGIGMTTGLRAH